MDWVVRTFKICCLSLMLFFVTANAIFNRYSIIHLWFSADIQSCSGNDKTYLESLCNKLPNDKCVYAPPANETQRCDENEFDCGYGECIPGMQLCDKIYQCKNGADELDW